MTLLPHPSRPVSWRRRKQPALAERVIHVDLKGPKIPFDVLRRLLGLYARWGINGVLVEYEHRLPRLPLAAQFPARDRYSVEQVREITELCRRLGIDFIPLVQTLGHVEYLRRLPGTAAMMENPAYPNQLCPSNAIAKRYIVELIDLICELHPQSRRINVGLDETHQLGHCPACARRAKKLGGRIELFVDHARWVCDEVLRRGRIPMLAADMLLGNGRDDLLKQLDPRIVVLPWDYRCVGDRAPYVLFKGNRPCKAAFRADLTGDRLHAPIPALPAAGGFADDLPRKNLARLGGIDRATGLARAFAQGHLLSRHRGRELWGIAAADASASGPFRPNFARGVLNCNQIVRELLKLKGHGAIATHWARGHSFAPINSMWPLGLYAFAHFAASAWTGETSPRDPQRRAPAIAAELGLPARLGEWKLDDVLWILSNPSFGGPSARVATLQTILGLLRASNAKGAFAEGLTIALEVESRWQQLLFIVEESRWWHPNREIVPPMIRREIRTRVRTILKSIDKLKPEARWYYTTWVGERAAFETWWRGLFEVDREVARRAVELV